MKTIKKSISISAPREKVWKVLFGKETYPIWTAHFSEGSVAETDWQEGSKAVFKDKSNSGIFGTITKNVPYKVLSITYEGGITNGVEDYENEDAKSLIGGVESYYLSDTDGLTTLAVESDMADKYFDQMSAAWDKALPAVKELAEKS